MLQLFGTPNSMLNTIESGYIAAVPSLRRKTHTISPSNIVLTVGFIKCMFCQAELLPISNTLDSAHLRLNKSSLSVVGCFFCPCLRTQSIVLRLVWYLRTPCITVVAQSALDVSTTVQSVSLLLFLSSCYIKL